MTKFKKSLFKAYGKYLDRIANTDIEDSLTAYVESEEWLKENGLGREFLEEVEQRLEKEMNLI
ncbi:hypothetical protein [Bacillus gaemokensis]|uniref:Uncharacterized protein n=1 Tax=Bacillus gaemokensis TaxID=574375 RepID=A0A073K6I7_9BACI|nr:hypothetical protein [Bacillus gaemokensis]KEK22062.1 hypothetical protein BAGA_22475 [Bacillus gaemokensis]KYG37773.1 hypothetical protein AZF08_21820 [Bacillus gaemokensis]